MHRARQDMRPDLEPFSSTQTLISAAELFQPDRRRQPRRAAADNDHVIFHAFALGHESPSSCLFSNWPDPGPKA